MVTRILLALLLFSSCHYIKAQIQNTTDVSQTNLTESTTTEFSEITDLFNSNTSIVILAADVEDVDLSNETYYVTDTSDVTDSDVINLLPGTNLTWNETDWVVEGNTTEFLSNLTTSAKMMSPDGNEGTIGTGESAFILAATFVVLAAIAYGGMLLWRRYLQIRYGNSDMLITEDAYDISDLRYFEI